MLPDDSDPQEWIFENAIVTFVTWLDESISTHWSTSLLRPPRWVMSRWLQRARRSPARRSPCRGCRCSRAWRQQPTTLTSSTVAPGLSSAMLPFSTTVCLVPSASPRGVSVLQALRPLSWPISCVPGAGTAPGGRPACRPGWPRRTTRATLQAPWTSSHSGWVVKRAVARAVHGARRVDGVDVAALVRGALEVAGQLRVDQSGGTGRWCPACRPAGRKLNGSARPAADEHRCGETPPLVHARRAELAPLPGPAAVDGGDALPRAVEGGARGADARGVAGVRRCTPPAQRGGVRAGTRTAPGWGPCRSRGRT